MGALAGALALLGGPVTLDANAGQPVSPYDPDTSGFSASALADVTASDSWTLDTDTGKITDSHGVVRAATTDGQVDHGIGVRFNVGGTGATEFVMRSLGVDTGVTLTSTGAAPLALLTAGALTLAPSSVVSVNAQGGAGGSATSPGSAAGGTGAGHNGSCPSGASTGAGGGGGFGGGGGSGGAAGPSAGAGGSSYGGSDQSLGLQAGSGGGSASLCPPPGSPQPASPGGGGLALVALGALTIGDLATVTASGVSGTAVGSQAGGGGGSGGGLVLMTPRLSLSPSAKVLATGGAGDYTNGSTPPGQDGGGGGGGGRITTVDDQPAPLTPAAVAGGQGGTSLHGQPGGNGTAGSLLDRLFLVATGTGAAAIGQTVSFSAATAIGAATYAWDFGDGTTASGPAVSHAFASAGTHTVTVTATMSDSSTTVSQRLMVSVPAGPPPAATHHRPACVVPHLKGLSAARAKTRLRAAHCALGRVTQPRVRRGHRKPRNLVVISQSLKPGRRLAFGAKVRVSLGPAPKPRRRRR